MSADGGVTWRRLPAALSPCPNYLDSLGCFSGCVFGGSVQGGAPQTAASVVPIIAYTAVRPRPERCKRGLILGELLPTSSGAAGGRGGALDEEEAGDAEEECNAALADQPFVEAQCFASPMAVADGEPHTVWVKRAANTAMVSPPRHLAATLCGWRDPFIFREGPAWRMLLGSGFTEAAGGGGAVLIYHTMAPCGTTGWLFDGLLCRSTDLARSRPPTAAAQHLASSPRTLAENNRARAGASSGPPPPLRGGEQQKEGLDERGALLDGMHGRAPANTSGDERVVSLGGMWECPILLAVPHDSAPAGRTTEEEEEGSRNDTPSQAAAASMTTRVLLLSPDSPSNPVLYFVGKYAGGRFDLASADGPHLLDNGDCLVCHLPVVRPPSCACPPHRRVDHLPLAVCCKRRGGRPRALHPRRLAPGARPRPRRSVPAAPRGSPQRRERRTDNLWRHHVRQYGGGGRSTGGGPRCRLQRMPGAAPRPDALAQRPPGASAAARAALVAAAPARPPDERAEAGAGPPAAAAGLQLGPGRR